MYSGRVKQQWQRRRSFSACGSTHYDMPANTAPLRGIYDVQLMVRTRRAFGHFCGFESFPFRQRVSSHPLPLTRAVSPPNVPNRWRTPMLYAAIHEGAYDKVFEM